MYRNSPLVTYFYFSTVLLLASASTIARGQNKQPHAVEKAKVHLVEAIDLATKAVPGSKTVRIELNGDVWVVIVVAGKDLREIEINAGTGKASDPKPAEMDEDEFKNGDAATKALTAAKITLADAVRLAEKEVAGKACEAEIKMVRDAPRYQVKVIGDSGAREIVIDGAKGEIRKPRPRPDDGKAYRDSFKVEKTNFVSSGRNPYFILEAGYRCHYAGGGETLTITVLKDTKMVDGIETRVVEEREEKNGKLAEISRNYFAIDKTTNDVYYFGEDVDIYRNGKVVNHEGAWLAGVNGVKFGLLMPGKPQVGDRFYQEVAPKVALDRAEIVSLDKPMSTPAGHFEKCLYVEETTPLESGRSRKWYAPGVGLVRDDDVLLTKVEDPKK